MKSYLIAVLGLLLAWGPVWAAEKIELKTDKEKVSYAIGLRLGQNMKREGIEVDQESFLKGLNDGKSGAEPLMTPAELQETMVKFSQEMMAKKRAAFEKKAAENKAKGQAFLEANKKKKGVKVTKSGLQYRVIKPGTGKSPKPDDLVTCHYRGMLIDGTEFDSSYARQQPATFTVSGVIAGWQEALPMMKEGAKWELVVPAELAYGLRGAGPKIGPNAVLVFEVELLKVGQDEKASKPAGKTKPEAKKDKK